MTGPPTHGRATQGGALPVDATNADQARSWDGDQGAYWAANAEHFDRAVAAYQDRFMSAASIAPGERVSTSDAAARPGGTRPAPPAPARRWGSTCPPR